MCLLIVSNKESNQFISWFLVIKVEYQRNMWAALSPDFLHSFVYLMCLLSCSPHLSFFVSYISRSRSALYTLILLSFHFILTVLLLCQPRPSVSQPLVSVRSLLFLPILSLPLSPSFAVFSFPRTPAYITRALSPSFSLSHPLSSQERI